MGGHGGIRAGIVGLLLLGESVLLYGSIPLVPDRFSRRRYDPIDYEIVGELGIAVTNKFGFGAANADDLLRKVWDDARKEFQPPFSEPSRPPGGVRVGGTDSHGNNKVPPRNRLAANLSVTTTVDPTADPGGSAQGANAMAFSGSGRNAFVANDLSKTVSAFSVDLDSGDLTQASGSPFPLPDAPKALVVDPSGRFLYVGGDFGTAAFRVDGLTSELTPIATYPYPVSFPDSLAVSDHFVFAKAFDFNTSHSTIQVLRIDPASGALTPTDSTGYTARTPGPLAVTREGDFLYVGESSTLTGYAVSYAGTLTPLASVNFPTQGPIMTMAVHPNRPYLYVSNFGSPQDSLQTYRFDYLTGSMTAVGAPIAEDSDTEGMAVHPSGGALYTSSPNTLTLTSFAIDHSTGLPTSLGTIPLTGGGNSLSVQFTPAPSLAATGMSYSQPLQVLGGFPPDTFHLTGGALPAGLTLDPATGIVSGTPSSAGASSFNVRVQDQAGAVADQTYAIQTVSPASVPAPPSGLTATAVSSREIQVSWQDNAQQQGAFRIEESLDGGDFIEIDHFPPGVTDAVLPGFSPATPYAFRVRAVSSGGGSAYSETAAVTTPPEASAPCTPSDFAACLVGGRFAVQATFLTSTGHVGLAHVVPLTSDTAYLWFFAESNVEAVVKVLNTCGINQHFWVFAGGLTNVAVAMRIFDLQTGAVRDFVNTIGKAFVPIQDTGAFGTCDASPASTSENVTFVPPPLSDEAATWRLPTGSSTCTPGDTVLCLDGARFQVEATFLTSDGRAGSAHMHQITPDTGYMWFFTETNVEAVVKVLDACGVNGHQWVFAGGLTNVDVQITVTDTVTGDVRHYHNPQGTPFQPVQDTSAFSCP